VLALVLVLYRHVAVGIVEYGDPAIHTVKLVALIEFEIDVLDLDLLIIGEMSRVLDGDQIDFD
jgi:hypothetical protein